MVECMKINTIKNNKIKLIHGGKGLCICGHYDNIASDDPNISVLKYDNYAQVNSPKECGDFCCFNGLSTAYQYTEASHSYMELISPKNCIERHVIQESSFSGSMWGE